jgi:hypothetical protein
MHEDHGGNVCRLVREQVRPRVIGHDGAAFILQERPQLDSDLGIGMDDENDFRCAHNPAPLPHGIRSH